MATSGSINYAVTRDQIITEAMEICGLLGDGESPGSNDLTTCDRTLNFMVKYWQAQGLNLFAVQTQYLFLQKNQNNYAMHASTSDHTTTSFVSTLINNSSGYASGVSSIVVDSITGISDADNIGIMQDDGTMHWTTVNGAPSGSTITLTDVTTDEISDNAQVYAYTSKANRFMRILEAYVHDDGGSDTPLSVVSRSDYWNLSKKTDDGQVNSVYYDPQIGSNPKLYVWPESDSEKEYLVLLVQRTLEDWESAAENPDFPQEWYLPLAWNLAYLIAPKYGVPLAKRNSIGRDAAEMLDEVLGFDVEDYVQFQPSMGC